MTQLDALRALEMDVAAGYITPDTPHCDLPWQPLLGAYAGDLNAAKALHEAVLPGYVYAIHSAVPDPDDPKKPGCILIPPGRRDICDEDCIFAEAETTARAWLIAIIRAIIAELEAADA